MKARHGGLAPPASAPSRASAQTVYIKVIPTCSAAQADTYSTGYQVTSSRLAFTLSCNGENHTKFGYLVDEPYFSLFGGLQPLR